MRSKPPIVAGVGINDADYTVKVMETYKNSDGVLKQKQTWVCPYYERWKHMITRCYSTKAHRKRPTYCKVEVCKAWLTFSNFKMWMEDQEWEGKHLDKDLLGDGTLYSPETCTFLPAKLNTFIAEGGSKSKFIGVSQIKGSSKFQAYCNNPFEHKTVYLGSYSTREAAFLARMKKKREFAQDLIGQGYLTKDKEIKALLQRYNYE